eukprot:4442737-Lingulodinium_polyedra.AAC.1
MGTPSIFHHVDDVHSPLSWIGYTVFFYALLNDAVPSSMENELEEVASDEGLIVRDLLMHPFSQLR